MTSYVLKEKLPLYCKSWKLMWRTPTCLSLSKGLLQPVGPHKLAGLAHGELFAAHPSKDEIFTPEMRQTVTIRSITGWRGRGGEGGMSRDQVLALVPDGKEDQSRLLRQSDSLYHSQMRRRRERKAEWEECESESSPEALYPAQFEIWLALRGRSPSKEQEGCNDWFLLRAEYQITQVREGSDWIHPLDPYQASLS